MWEMGGYGLYVWPSYGLVLGGMLLLLVRTVKQSVRIKNQIKTSAK